MSYTAAQHITAVRDQFGEDDASNSAVTDTQVLSFLNQSQRELCWEGDILLTCASASTAAGQQTYALPSDYLRVSAVFMDRPASWDVRSSTAAASTTINTTVTNGFLKVLAGYTVTGTLDSGVAFSTTVSSIIDSDSIIVNGGALTLTGKTITFTNANGGLQQILEPISVNQRDPTRAESTQQLQYYVWGENVTVSGQNVNRYVVGLVDVPSVTSGYDLHVYYRQLPQVMTTGGGSVAAEVADQWQDAMISGAMKRIYSRLCTSDTKWIPLYDRYKAEWDQLLIKARRYVNPLMLDRPRQIQPVMGKGFYAGAYA